MATQANVYTNVSNQVWFTDKARIVAGNCDVGYNVFLAPTFADAIWNGTPYVRAGQTLTIYVGVGNKLNLASAYLTYEVQEIGTQSSGTAGH